MPFHNQQLIKLITKAIKDMDRGFFFIADYEKQASNVLKQLELSGYRIVPNNPSAEMVENGVKAVKMGITEPETLVNEVYHNMING